MRNHGVNLTLEKQQQDERDWMFGSLSMPCITDIALSVRGFYLPKGERQNIGEDKMDCASRAPVNILETKFNWLLRNGKLKNVQWLQENGYIKDNYIEFSDRYIAILSGTTRQGNSLKAPLQAIHEWGMIPKAMFPQVDSFDEYYSGLTEEMKTLGKKFSQLFIINYERVLETNFVELLEHDIMDVAGYAWPMPIDGVYPRSSLPHNHAFILWKPQYFAFDNYPDTFDGDFIKQLANDYDFWEYGYRIFISEEKAFNVEKQIPLLKKIVEYLYEIIGLKKKIEQIEMTVDEHGYMWDTREHARKSCRMIMDTYNLKWAEKDLLCAVIEAESGFKLKAYNKNKDDSNDWGICQINDKWHIGDGKTFKTREDALDPVQAVGFMCKMFKAGKLDLWWAYKNGSYVEYMPK